MCTISPPILQTSISVSEKHYLEGLLMDLGSLFKSYIFLSPKRDRMSFHKASGLLVSVFQASGLLVPTITPPTFSCVLGSNSGACACKASPFLAELSVEFSSLHFCGHNLEVTLLPHKNFHPRRAIEMRNWLYQFAVVSTMYGSYCLAAFFFPFGGSTI